MAFTLEREKRFELDLTYRGPVAVLELEFSFVFGPIGDPIDILEAIVNVALFSADVLPVIQINYLKYTIESDTDPFIDRYRVKVMLAGEVDNGEGVLGPFSPFARAKFPQAVFPIVPLLAIAVAIGVVLVFVAISWRTYTRGLIPAIFGEGWTGILALGAIGFGLYLAFGRGKRRRSG